MNAYFVAVIFYFEVKVSAIYKPPWSYDEENIWPGQKCKEGGKRQSPIDIRVTDVVRDFDRDFIKYARLKFKGYQNVLVSAINNGHTVQFSTEGDIETLPILSGGPLKHEYRLEQLHFHWLSEHAINGVKFPMEMHFVHVRCDLEVREALEKQDGLAILAVFCNVQTELEEYQEAAINELMQHIPNLLETGDTLEGITLDMTKLIDPYTESYFTYSGSLTSPQCNEAVIWIIYNTPIAMSDSHYRLFGKIGVGRHNFRSLQKIEGKVFTPANTDVQTPQMANFFRRQNCRRVHKECHHINWMIPEEFLTLYGPIV